MTSTDHSEHRTIITFCVNLGKTPAQNRDMIQESAIKPAVSISLVFKWHKRFKDGREDIHDDTGRGRKATLDMTSVAKIKDVIDKNRRYTVRGISDLTGISRASVHRILTKHLHMRKLSARWVLWLLTKDHTEWSGHTSRRFLSSFRQEEDTFLDRIITTDETWLFLYDPETKEQSRQWKADSSPPPKKARRAKSVGKHMYIFFMDISGMLLQHAVPLHTTVNSSYYSKVLRRDLFRAIRHKRPGLELESVLLHQDNAPNHTAAATQFEINWLEFETVEHAPYSPEMAPMDFRVFPVVKSALKGHKINNFHELSVVTHTVAAGFEREWYRDTFAQWLSIHEKCIRCSGYYIEKT